MRRRSGSWWLAVLALAAPVLGASSLLEMPSRALDRATVERIRKAPKDGKTVLRDVVLSDAETKTLELEEFSPWASDAVILVYDSTVPRRIAPPARRYFKGRVAGDPTGMVFLSVSTSGPEVDGMIITGERTFAVGQGRRLQTRAPQERGDAPIIVREFDPLAGLTTPFRCALERVGPPEAPFSPIPLQAAPRSDAATVVAKPAYEFRVAVDSDNEFYASFGSPGTATDNTVAQYLGDLVAQTSVIYMRDLNTTVVIGQMNIRPSNVPDPFVAGNNVFHSLTEFGAAWHNNYPAVPRSVAVLVSGRYLGGLAWKDRMCRNDFACSTGCYGDPATAGHWGGSYAVVGPPDGRTLPNPNATVNGVLYGVPQSNYWILYGFAHEIGHVIGAPHTQCVTLNADEKILFGVTRDYVDECYSGSEYGCFSGSPSVPAEKGTIMSYCDHAIDPGGYPQTRFIFGEPGVTSSKMLDILNDSLNYRFPSTPVTAGSNVPCAAGQTASISPCYLCTYAWRIDGGTIDGPSTNDSISFTPTAATVTVHVAVTSDNSCKFTTAAVISAAGCGTSGADLSAAVSLFQSNGGSAPGTGTADCTGDGTIDGRDLLCLYALAYPAPPAAATSVLDLDLNASVQPLADGLLLLRKLFGFGGTTLTGGALGTGAARTSGGDIQTYADRLAPAFDIDRDGSVQPLTDGLLVLRYLFGFRGATLINGALGGAATRTSAAAIEHYIGSL